MLLTSEGRYYSLARYTKGFLPLSKVKEKEFLSRRMGCKGVGLPPPQW
jgi:hypothetical protein